MTTALHALETILPILYVVTAMNYSFDFVRDDPFAKRMNGPLLYSLLLVHTLYLVLRSIAYAHIPLASLHEMLTSLAFSVTLVYLYVEFRTKTPKTGIFFLAVALILQTLASALATPIGSFPPVLRSPLFALHAGSAILGYTAFTISALYGVLYLVLYYDLRSQRFGIVYRKLPPLEVMAKMCVRAMVLGVAFLTITLFVGVLWATKEFPDFYTDPKFMGSLLVWFVYLAGVVLHYRFGWRGKRAVYFILAGFALIILTTLTAAFWLHSFHGFI